MEKFLASKVYNVLYFIDANFSNKPIGYSINDNDTDTYWRGHAGYFTESFNIGHTHKKRVLINNPFLKIEWDKYSGWTWDKPRLRVDSCILLNEKVVVKRVGFGLFNLLNLLVSKYMLERRFKGWFQRVKKEIKISIV